MSDTIRSRGTVGRDGFSLVEVIIAILILAVGVLGLAGTTAHITRQITLADLMTERSVAFQTVIDRLQSLPYDDVGTGSDSVGVYLVRWAATMRLSLHLDSAESKASALAGSNLFERGRVSKVQQAVQRSKGC